MNQTWKLYMNISRKTLTISVFHNNSGGVATISFFLQTMNIHGCSTVTTKRWTDYLGTAPADANEPQVPGGKGRQKGSKVCIILICIVAEECTYSIDDAAINNGSGWTNVFHSLWSELTK